MARGSPTTISERGVHSFHRYLVKTVAQDRPMDQFARELLTGLGNTLHKPAASFYRVSRTPEDCAESFAQLFLGVRMQCAKCHNHPGQRWTQDDYYGMAAFFARVQYRDGPFFVGINDLTGSSATTPPTSRVRFCVAWRLARPISTTDRQPTWTRWSTSITPASASA